jgi:hypothetical protein
MSNTKRLIALYQLPDGRIHRKTLKEGRTADFAHPLGYVIEDLTIEISDPDENGNSSGGMSFDGLNGTYPVLFGESLSKLEGKLLTLCDLTFSDLQQREAFKSLVRENLWSFMDKGIDFTEKGYYSESAPTPTNQ